MAKLKDMRDAVEFIKNNYKEITTHNYSTDAINHYNYFSELTLSQIEMLFEDIRQNACKELATKMFMKITDSYLYCKDKERSKVVKITKGVFGLTIKLKEEEVK